MVISGDICPNPGPEKCNICSRTVAHNHRAMRCDSCKSQSHINCANIKPSEYKGRQQSVNASWSCPVCTFKSLQTELPFYEVDNATLDEQTTTNLNESGVETTTVVDVADNIQFESRRKHTGRDILICHINIIIISE